MPENGKHFSVLSLNFSQSLEHLNYLTVSQFGFQAKKVVFFFLACSIFTRSGDKIRQMEGKKCEGIATS